MAEEDKIYQVKPIGKRQNKGVGKNNILWYHLSPDINWKFQTAKRINASNSIIMTRLNLRHEFYALEFLRGFHDQQKLLGQVVSPWPSLHPTKRCEWRQTTAPALRSLLFSISVWVLFRPLPVFCNGVWSWGRNGQPFNVIAQWQFEPTALPSSVLCSTSWANRPMIGWHLRKTTS